MPHRITFSPKVFIPLTQLCRDGCWYCTFAQPPKNLAAPFMSPEQVVEVALRGAEAGCHEALFTLGEAPETQYAVAREWLAEHGYATTVEYLAAMCKLVLEETGLLPHANAGAHLARGAGAAAGRLRLAGHDARVPARGPAVPPRRAGQAPGPPPRHAGGRGELAIPFTTGILVGIGEDRARTGSTRCRRSPLPTPATVTCRR